MSDYLISGETMTNLANSVRTLSGETGDMIPNEIINTVNNTKSAIDSLNEHINDENNPHGVTAADVGARPNTWMPTAADVGAVQRDVLWFDTPNVRLIDYVQAKIREGYPSAVIQVFGITPSDIPAWVGAYGLVYYQCHGDGYVEVRIVVDGSVRMAYNKFIRVDSGNPDNWLLGWTEIATTDYALPRDGSSHMTSGLVIARTQNGYSMVDKNHDANGDYGTDIRDYDSTNAVVSLKLRAAYNDAFFVDKYGTWHSLIHSGNKDQIYTYGTDDIQAGSSSPYANGHIHFVIE